MSIICFLFSVCGLSAQETYAFAERDSVMHLDVYKPAKPNGYTIVHVFGGGFVGGYRIKKWDADYCRQLADSGFTAVAIDYRLGLRGVKNVGLKTIDALEQAIYMAVEDCSAAVAYIVTHSAEVGIDPQKIIIEGSSAGAITALMTDYARCNGLPCAAALPDNWTPAAIVAYSGAIFSRQGKPKWGNDKKLQEVQKVQEGQGGQEVSRGARDAAPTLMFHGTADKLVPYKQIELGKTGLYGSSAIAKQMKKQNIPYQIHRYTDLGHEVSIGGPLTADVLCLFVRQFIQEKRKLHIDTTIRDDAYPPSEFSKISAKDIYK